MRRRFARDGITTQPGKWSKTRPLTIFRYPGGKAKLLAQIQPWLKKATLYIEPFVGGGSVALAVAQANPVVSLVLNDLDKNIYSFWHVVACSPEEQFEKLVQRIRATKPTVALFRRLKADPGGTTTQRAFAALYINRCAFGGNARSGPLGGYNQKGKGKVDQRWKAPKLIGAVRQARQLLHGRTTVLNDDFAVVIALADEHSFIYLDPPYYEAGNQLYTSLWTDADHQRLADALRKCKCRWSLSYDQHRRIIGLVAGETKGQFPVGGRTVSASYSISKRKHREVLYFFSPDDARKQNPRPSPESVVSDEVPS